MKLSYDPNLYALSDGRQLAKFLGIQPAPEAMVKNSPFPNSGPSIIWRFEILTGEDKGKIAISLTPQHPTPKNATMRMLVAVIGRPVKPNEEVDLDAFNGHFYGILIHEGRLSNKFVPMRYGPHEGNARQLFELNSVADTSEPDSVENSGF